MTTTLGIFIVEAKISGTKFPEIIHITIFFHEIRILKPANYQIEYISPD